MISILLPNLNNRPYLDERIHSIREQSLTDWELIVMDGYSQDGAWEFFKECAREDPRLKLHQSEVKGIYSNINRCLELASGEFIYIATSDDTMSLDALEKMSRALENHPQCGIAHCKLRIIDEKGNPSPEKTWDDFFVIRYFGDLINKRHVRIAPHDGLLHYCGITVYTSLTQLLIRRSVFDRVGRFLTEFGSIGDYEWDMRASLVTDTIHIPEYLATWRLHHDQATGDELLRLAKSSGQFLNMADTALATASRLNPELKKHFRIKAFRSLLKKDRRSHLSQKQILHSIEILMQGHGLDRHLQLLEDS